jgi:PPOX class probable FMN-dependent enzyme
MPWTYRKRSIGEGAAMQSDTEKFARFTDFVTNIDDVLAVLGQPMPQVIAKVTDRLDDVCRRFIATSPFCLVASSDPTGFIDVSPKGDPAGFVQVLDDKHLAIPDRPGNRRVDTFHNLFKDPRVGLIFIIPGKRETLRISGEARIVRDAELRRSMAINGRVPELALVVYVERIFTHCPKCMVRSKLWEPEAWPDHSNTASHREAMIKHGKLDMTIEELEAEAVRTGTTRLY